MHSFYLDAIRSFEGYTAKASWDYAQFTNGYGTKARYSGEVITRAEADRRFEAEVANARAIVERNAPDVDEGTKAALTSLTFNAGTAWVKSGLGEAVRSGDLEKARDLFTQYNKAGGEVLPGLVSRRAAEAMWIGNPEAINGSMASLASSEAVRQSPAVSAVLDGGGATGASASPPMNEDHLIDTLVSAAQTSSRRSLLQSSPGSATLDASANLSSQPDTRADGLSPVAHDVLAELARLVRVDPSLELRAEDVTRGETGRRA